MIDPQTLVGRTLAGKYQVVRVIGVGGMGVVVEGRNLELGKRVAIKLIDRSHAMSAELAERLRREARAAAAVESDAIVAVFDVGEDPDLGLFMVMEFLVGEDLHARLEREKKLDPNTAVQIAWRIARALARAHGAGIIHRDLKPANIFLGTRDDGSLLVKVLDFGISKVLVDERVAEANRRPGLTRMGAVIGTPNYMSPEQAQGLPTIDHRTDIWALGALIYEMLAGQPAYPEMPTYEQTIMRILMNRPTPVLAIAPWVPPALANIVDRALEHDVALRIPDAMTFANRLSEAMGPGAQPMASGGFPIIRSDAAHAMAQRTAAIGAPAATLTPQIVGLGAGTPAQPPQSQHAPIDLMVTQRASQAPMPSKPPEVRANAETVPGYTAGTPTQASDSSVPLVRKPAGQGRGDRGGARGTDRIVGSAVRAAAAARGELPPAESDGDGDGDVARARSSPWPKVIAAVAVLGIVGGAAFAWRGMQKEKGNAAAPSAEVPKSTASAEPATASAAPSIKLPDTDTTKAATSASASTADTSKASAAPSAALGGKAPGKGDKDPKTGKLLGAASASASATPKASASPVASVAPPAPSATAASAAGSSSGRVWGGAGMPGDY